MSMDRTPADVVRLLEQELAGTVDRDEWDELVCVPDADPRLEEIRRQLPMEGALMAEGRRAVEQALQALRSVDPRHPH